MNYKDKIKIAIKRANENLAFDRKLRDEALEAFKKREKEEEEPIRLLIQQYLDEELKDVNGNTVREGYIIAVKNGYPAYKVIKRGMQFVFGTPMFNPSVEVLTYSPTKNPQTGKKVKSIHKSELSQMVIMFDDRNKSGVYSRDECMFEYCPTPEECRKDDVCSIENPKGK